MFNMENKCFECGVCCKLFLINLTEEEYKSGKYKTQFEMFGLVNDFKEAERCAANILEQKEDGSCIYLKKGRCSIHKTRPKSCRGFFCTSRNKQFKGMIEKIKGAKGKKYAPTKHQHIAALKNPTLLISKSKS